MRCFRQIQDIREIPVCKVRIIRKENSRYFLIPQHIIDTFAVIRGNNPIKMNIPVQDAQAARSKQVFKNFVYWIVKFFNFFKHLTRRVPSGVICPDKRGTIEKFPFHQRISGIYIFFYLIKTGIKFSLRLKYSIPAESNRFQIFCEPRFVFTDFLFQVLSLNKPIPI